MSLHWLTLTGPVALSEAGMRRLDAFFGPEREQGGAGRFYQSSWRWVAGCSLWVEHVNAKEGVDSCMIDVPGAVLELLEPDERVELLAELLYCGFRSTRLDVAVDEKRGKWAELQQRIRDAFKRREVCGTRTINKKDSQVLGGAEALTTYLGRAGSDGSGRMTCVYDKGLESGTTREPGEWTRWEGRFYDDCAAQASMAIATAGDEWPRVAAELALGAVDFRARVKGETALSRRGRLAWWSEVREGLADVLVVRGRRLANLDGRVKWLKAQVLPGLARLAGLAEFEPRRDSGALCALLDALGVGVIEAGKLDRAALEYRRFREPTWSDLVAAFVVDEVAAWRAELIGESFARERRQRRCATAWSG